MLSYYNHSIICSLFADLAQIDGKEVEDLFSGVLSPTEHQQSQSSTTPVPPGAAAAPSPATPAEGMMGPPPAPVPMVPSVHPAQQRRPAPTSLPLQLSGSQPQVNLPVPQSPQPRTPQNIGRWVHLLFI